MLARLISFALTLVSFAADTKAAEIAGGVQFPVQVAILLEDGEPFTGDVHCVFGQECKIFTRGQHGLSLSLMVGKRSDYFRGELTLHCESQDCSFSNGSSSLEFDCEREFKFFEGRYSSREAVLRILPKLGSILLILPETVSGCHMPPQRFKPV
ncbi:hypothetical protein [Shinella sp. JR1-6]|uniref:hypothetical protein n=1 Tax=Shinella sp. JR1-6 TaxID=2527671 RepID=UPI00102D52AF|nr:hypothetical protein [Shinella sp. JR1-6]TAA61672.1 hypothetical protein EXZ48_11035 [Shinella sp. JR1-6]